MVPLVGGSVFIAYCSSEVCDPGVYRQTCSKGVEKHLERKVMECPDCGHILFWPKKPKINYQKDGEYQFKISQSAVGNACL